MSLRASQSLSITREALLQAKEIMAAIGKPKIGFRAYLPKTYYTELFHINKPRIFIAYPYRYHLF